MKTTDEDFAYEQARQRRIDAERIANTQAIQPSRRRVRVFPKFAQHVGPQRYANRDPRPDLPFEDDHARFLRVQRQDKWVATGLAFACGVLLALEVLEKLGWIL